MATSRSKTESVLRVLIISLFFIYAFCSFTQPLADPDTSWHLKTGEYVFENRTIPQEDPFSALDDEIPFLGKFILTQYWLGQVVMHLVYANLGTLGLALFGAATFTGIIFFVWRVLKNTGPWLSLLLTGGIAMLMLQDFLAIRPQMFTFLFTAVTIFLLEKYKEERTKGYLACLPFLMLVWANMHGGYIYGVVVMFIYLFSEYASLFLKSRSVALPCEPLPKEEARYLLIICIVSVVFSIFNPNTYMAFVYALNTHSGLFANIAEYQSPFGPLKIEPASIIIRYWIDVVVMVPLLLFFIVRRNITPALLIIFSISLTFMSIRYIPLFVIVAVSVFKYVPFEMKKGLSEKAGYVMKAAGVLLLGGAIFLSHPFKGVEHYQYSDSTFYPVTASKFLEENNINGNILASYNKSSFLMFQRFPGSRVFFDSRYISEERQLKALWLQGDFDPIISRLEEINMLIPEGVGTITVTNEEQRDKNAAERLRWRAALDEMKAEIIVYEAMNTFSGQIYPIVFKLMQEDDWKLIHADGNVMVFIKDLNKYREIIDKFNKPKSLVYDEILVEGVEGLKLNVRGYYTSVALALLLKGIATDETLYYIERAASNAPDDIMVNYCRTLYMLMTRNKVSG